VSRPGEIEPAGLGGLAVFAAIAGCRPNVPVIDAGPEAKQMSSLTHEFAEAARAVAPRASTLVLLAEDDLELRKLIAATLREEGYEVVEATNGMELLDSLEIMVARRIPYAIVSDVRMPLLSGMDVLAVIRASSTQVPVVLITAFGDADTHGEAHDLGAVAILDKPFDMSALTALLGSIDTTA
jgi:CheY-like chemotaxis protein